MPTHAFSPGIKYLTTDYLCEDVHLLFFRCTKSLNEGMESAHQEELMTKVWCRQSYDRIMSNLNELKNPETLENYKTMAKISEAVCSKNAPVQGNPLGF